MKGPNIDRDYVAGELKKIKKIAEKDPAKARRLEADLHRTVLQALGEQALESAKRIKAAMNQLQEAMERLLSTARDSGKAYETAVEALKSSEIVFPRDEEKQAPPETAPGDAKTEDD